MEAYNSKSLIRIDEKIAILMMMIMSTIWIFSLLQGRSSYDGPNKSSLIEL